MSIHFLIHNSINQVVNLIKIRNKENPQKLKVYININMINFIYIIFHNDEV